MMARKQRSHGPGDHSGVVYGEQLMLGDTLTISADGSV
jgi:hypothetical protein